MQQRDKSIEPAQLEKAKITISSLNKEIDLPLLRGTEEQYVIDISKLHSEGIDTFDNGFMSTAACKSTITYIDGEAGILRHRGYEIGELVQRSNFLELCYLLLYGELPTQGAYDSFVQGIKRHTMVHEQMQFMYRGFPRFAHPMAIIAGAVNSLSAFYHDHIDIKKPEDRINVAIKIIAKMPTLAAMAYKYSVGQPFVQPQNKLQYTENFLNMMFALPTEEYSVSPIAAKTMDALFMLHADHEQNASTSTVRLAGSSGANPFSVIGAGIAALWGPAHGGANEAVIQMLKEIGDVSEIPKYIKKAQDKNDPFRLMGFGHRVYKNYDPRALVIKEMCHQVINEIQQQYSSEKGYEKGQSDGAFDTAAAASQKNSQIGSRKSQQENLRLLEIALKLEEIALKDEYFIERKLFPNVDFYSGIVYMSIGIPTQMFTVIFAIARTVGWISQWKEMVEDKNMRIGRPRQLYMGKGYRPYVEMERRRDDGGGSSS